MINTIALKSMTYAAIDKKMTIVDQECVIDVLGELGLMTRFLDETNLQENEIYYIGIEEVNLELVEITDINSLPSHILSV